MDGGMGGWKEGREEGKEIDRIRKGGWKDGREGGRMDGREGRRLIGLGRGGRWILTILPPSFPPYLYSIYIYIYNYSVSNSPLLLVLVSRISFLCTHQLTLTITMLHSSYLPTSLRDGRIFTSRGVCSHAAAALVEDVLLCLWIGWIGLDRLDWIR